MEGGTPLITGTPADIEAIMAIYRGPGFEPLVGRWMEQRLLEGTAPLGNPMPSA